MKPIAAHYMASKRVINWGVVHEEGDVTVSVVCIRRASGWVFESSIPVGQWGDKDQKRLDLCDVDIEAGKHVVLAKLLGFNCMSYTPLIPTEDEAQGS